MTETPKSSSAADAIPWRPILGFIRQKKVIPIIGQDLLTVRIGGREVLLQKLLAERLADYLDVSADDLPDGSELNEVACRHYRDNDGDIETLCMGLHEQMPTRDEIEELPPALLKLAEISELQFFGTTTFDPLMQWALDEVRSGDSKTRVLAFSPEDVDDLDREVSELAAPTVYHLFGKVSSEPAFAITEEDKLEWVHALQSRETRPRLLFSELDRCHLMIGNRFPDWLARFFVRLTTNKRLKEAKGKFFVADSAVIDDKGLLSFLSQFPRHTKVYGGDPVQFVDELRTHWVPPAPAPAPAPAPPVATSTPAEPAFESKPGSKPGSGLASEESALTSVAADVESGWVFLSYATPDLAAARKIRDKLDAAGIDVWFDRKDIRAGTDIEQAFVVGVEKCSVFIPVISRVTSDPNERRDFRMEWKLAQKEAMRIADSVSFIVPVAIDDTPLEAEGVPLAFRKKLWRRADGGNCSPEFVEEVRDLFRRFQERNSG